MLVPLTVGTTALQFWGSANGAKSQSEDENDLMEMFERSSWNPRRRLMRPLSVVSRILLLAIIVLGSVISLASVRAQDAGAPATPLLADKQNEVTERYRRLEELLLRLADVEAEENPERAALLRRAARQSRDTFVLEKLVAASDSLKSEKFANAIENQGAAKEGLDKLLTLLLSEDRPQRIRDEKKRIANMIKELKVVERLQRSTRARTENGADLEDVGKEQEQISDRSEKVNDDLKSEEEKDADSKEGESAESKSGEKKSEESKPSDPKSGEMKPSEGEPKESDSKEGEPKESSEPPNGESKEAESKEAESKEAESKEAESKEAESKQADGKPSESKPSDSKPSESESQPEGEKSEPSPQGKQGEQGQQSEQQKQQPQPKSPEQEAQSQLEKAIKQMREAEKQLDEAKRNEAVEEQKKAEENLRAAIDRLEKILRQLREEEMQRELARLESRLRKMAQMQGKVLDETKALAAIPEAQRDRQVDLKSGNLAFEEKKIVMEADRAMLLLREEGTSVAFPEVMAQIRGDMQRVAERLAATKIDLVTTGIQDDILAALEEMISALQQAQRDLEKKKQEEQQQGGQKSGGEQGEQPLVEQIAELKLIRTMETRIKSTTERYADIINQEPSGTDDVIPLLRDLSDRQSKLYRITRDLVLKRNQ